MSAFTGHNCKSRYTCQVSAIARCIGPPACSCGAASVSAELQCTLSIVAICVQASPQPYESMMQHGLTGCVCDADPGNEGVEACSSGSAGSQHSAEHDPGEPMTALWHA